MTTEISATSAAYARRIHRVLEYIGENLDEKLTVDQLSRVASFSKFHFHRQFSAFCGVNIGRYIQLMKLKRASYRLAFHPEHRVINIALDAGFETPESFSRAFRRAFGQTPTAFRKKAEWGVWHEQITFNIPPRERNSNMSVQILETPPVLVAALEHRGSHTLLNATIQRFIEWRKQTGLSPASSSQTFGIPYNDPNTTPPEEFRFDICGSIDAVVPENDLGVKSVTIPAGRCAVTRHTGSRDDISHTVYALYREWLPMSGEELRDFPVYFQYLNVDSDTPEHAHLTDIYLPLK